MQSTHGIRFADVAGEDEAKENLQEIVDYLHDPGKYESIGASMPKGILLVGPPGTGKTMLAKAVAGESNVPFFSISGSEFVEMFVGMGASKVRDLFRQAKEKAPCIVFIDEIDAIGQKRNSGNLGGNDVKEPIYDLYSGWDKNKPIVDCIAPDGDFNTVTGMLSAVGLGDVPAWLRPFHVLSNGEKFRAGLARLACERPQHAVAGALQHRNGHLTAAALFVPQQVLPPRRLRQVQPPGQVIALQQRPQPGQHGGLVAAVGRLPAEHLHHTSRHALAVGIAAAAQCLHGVAEGMAEIQQPTGAFVPLILRHQRRLAGKAPADDPGPVRLLLLQPGQQLLISDAAVFDDLGHAAGQLTPGQGGEADGIRQYHTGLVEAAQQVFPLRQIQPRFAAYGAVHLRQQGAS